MSGTTITTLSIIFSIAAIVLLYIFIMPKSKREGLEPFGKFLHDLFNFKSLVLEHILKFTYVLATVFTVIYGFFMLFYVDGYYDEWMGYNGLIILIVGPISVRIIYETFMMLILAVKNIMEINNKMPEKQANKNDQAPNNANTFSPSEEAEAKYCASCGTHLDENGICPYCMKKY